ncbi:hypothetical protein FVE85_6671 [Porphyridium purpureum]|uniref:Ig-like domain-containing protein n=1 Tax=Porphyridium purpureum TaxID=35688 RepID=A0A5J4Z5X5_PORPP|nr:hypothetical protein FVE85_6671 [Porphyridium purpureum]|eukprot:POR9683..scf295_1
MLRSVHAVAHLHEQLLAFAAGPYLTLLECGCAGASARIFPHGFVIHGISPVLVTPGKWLLACFGSALLRLVMVQQEQDDGASIAGIGQDTDAAETDCLVLEDWVLSAHWSAVGSHFTLTVMLAHHQLLGYAVRWVIDKPSAVLYRQRRSTLVEITWSSENVDLELAGCLGLLNVSGTFMGDLVFHWIGDDRLPQHGKVGSADGWPPVEDKILSPDVIIERAHEGPIFSMAWEKVPADYVSLSPPCSGRDGHLSHQVLFLLTAGYDRSVRLWRVSVTEDTQDDILDSRKLCCSAARSNAIQEQACFPSGKGTIRIQVELVSTHYEHTGRVCDVQLTLLYCTEGQSAVLERLDNGERREPLLLCTSCGEDRTVRTHALHLSDAFSLSSLSAWPGVEASGRADAQSSPIRQVRVFVSLRSTGNRVFRLTGNDSGEVRLDYMLEADLLSMGQAFKLALSQLAGALPQSLRETVSGPALDISSGTGTNGKAPFGGLRVSYHPRSRRLNVDQSSKQNVPKALRFVSAERIVFTTSDGFICCCPCPGPESESFGYPIAFEADHITVLFPLDPREGKSTYRFMQNSLLTLPEISSGPFCGCQYAIAGTADGFVVAICVANSDHVCSQGRHPFHLQVPTQPVAPVMEIIHGDGMTLESENCFLFCATDYLGRLNVFRLGFRGPDTEFIHIASLHRNALSRSKRETRFVSAIYLAPVDSLLAGDADGRVTLFAGILAKDSEARTSQGALEGPSASKEVMSSQIIESVGEIRPLRSLVLVLKYVSRMGRILASGVEGKCRAILLDLTGLREALWDRGPLGSSRPACMSTADLLEFFSMGDAYDELGGIEVVRDMVPDKSLSVISLEQGRSIAAKQKDTFPPRNDLAYRQDIPGLARFCLGFRSTELLVIDLQSSDCLLRIECGGWKRSLDICVPTGTLTEMLAVVYWRVDSFYFATAVARAEQVPRMHIHPRALTEFKFVKTLVPGCHTLRVNCATHLSFRSPEHLFHEGDVHLFLTGGEDTLIKVWLVRLKDTRSGEEGFLCRSLPSEDKAEEIVEGKRIPMRLDCVLVHAITEHSSSVNCICNVTISSSASISFSGGGSNELFCWELVLRKESDSDSGIVRSGNARPHVWVTQAGAYSEKSVKRGQATPRVTAIEAWKNSSEIPNGENEEGLSCSLLVGRSDGTISWYECVLSVGKTRISCRTWRRLALLSEGTGSVTHIHVVEVRKDLVLAFAADTGGSFIILRCILSDRIEGLQLQSRFESAFRRTGLHASGINTFCTLPLSETTHCGSCEEGENAKRVGGSWLVATGGDDEHIVLMHVRLHENFDADTRHHILGAHVWLKLRYHCAAVTGLSWTRSYEDEICVTSTRRGSYVGTLVSVGADQSMYRSILYRAKESNCLDIMKLDDSVGSGRKLNIPDIAGLCNILGGDVAMLVYGAGIELVQ